MTESAQLAKACTAWWHDLDNRPGDRAHLRRAGSIDDALMVPATHHLGDSLRKLGLRGARRAALLASLLAQAKECDANGETMPERLGQRQGDRATFSEARFRRLLQAADEDDLLHHLRRAIRILGGQVHVPSLVEAVRFWSFDPDKRTRIISSWASGYYSKAPFPSSL
jgi:CRISPR type I-E-associated protein CasB/Cse2